MATSAKNFISLSQLDAIFMQKYKLLLKKKHAASIIQLDAVFIQVKKKYAAYIIQSYWRSFYTHKLNTHFKRSEMEESIERLRKLVTPDPSDYYWCPEVDEVIGPLRSATERGSLPTDVRELVCRWREHEEWFNQYDGGQHVIHWHELRDEIDSILLRDEEIR